jgi:hypothetical protein
VLNLGVGELQFLVCENRSVDNKTSLRGWLQVLNEWLTVRPWEHCQTESNDQYILAIPIIKDFLY